MTNHKGFFVSKTVFLIAVGVVFLLLFATGFLVRERSAMQEQTRQLIIENDSVMSVNLILLDSLKGKVSATESRKTVFSSQNRKK